MNNSYHFLQAPGFVALFTEYNHQLRIIPLDGRAHPRPGVRLFNGDSVGRWEGDTLIVETANVATSRASGLGSLDFQGTPFTDALSTVERFTIVDADTITFQVTLNDPEAYTRPVTIAGAFVRAPKDFMVLEHSCHEGNHFNMDIMAFRIPRSTR
jgi:hypothetical protein